MSATRPAFPLQIGKIAHAMTDGGRLGIYYSHAGMSPVVRATSNARSVSLELSLSRIT